MTSNTTATPDQAGLGNGRLRATALRLAATFCIACLAILVVRYWNDFYAQQDPSCRTEPAPYAFRAQTLAEIAMQCLGDGDVDRAQALAMTALGRQPMNQMAMAVLGSAADLEGRVSAADQWFSIASRLGHRDFSTEFYQASQSLYKRNLEEAAEHLDALLRSGWNNDLATDIALQLESSSAGRIALSRVMADDPPWIYQYLKTVTRLSDEQLWSRSNTLTLLAARKPKTFGEISLSTAEPTINELYLRKKVDAAYALRNAFEPYQRVEIVRDPLFSNITGGISGPFDWQSSNDPNLNISFSKNKSGRSFVTVHVYNPGSYLIVAQTIRLSEGRHSLDFSFKPVENMDGEIMIRLEDVTNGSKDQTAFFPLTISDSPKIVSLTAPHGSQFFRISLWINFRDEQDAEIELHSLSESPQ